jgi:hypothetical protein
MKPNLHSPYTRAGCIHTSAVKLPLSDYRHCQLIPAVAFVTAVLSSQIITREFWCVTFVSQRVG